MLHSSGECARGEARGGNIDCCPHALGEGDNSPTHSRESRRSCPTAAQRGGGGRRGKSTAPKRRGGERGSQAQPNSVTHSGKRGNNEGSDALCTKALTTLQERRGVDEKKGRCGGKQKKGEQERVNVCSKRLFFSSQLLGGDFGASTKPAAEATAMSLVQK